MKWPSSKKLRNRDPARARVLVASPFKNLVFGLNGLQQCPSTSSIQQNRGRTDQELNEYTEAFQICEENDEVGSVNTKRSFL
ncbi:hypothetical protein K443DRAFT_686177 [Laccaria amethystina LaAM-08-1]|uniref:Uncharacterized protein n=1 Tax=Laccaria amethystina LaAM-08-1 TaxID=1095629 RepID=A0A0C9WHI8_9AGAR|nr:hypothetical protein K443DRAFT_686177 [Laccaria amethystina LaAM-08-1]